MHRKLATLASLLLLLQICLFAQDTKPAETDADKQKKQEETDKRVVQLLERSIADADSLRLPENRALVYGVTGDLYWKYDEKRSRELFRSAANELMLFNQETERERGGNNPLQDIMSSLASSARSEILPLVAKHDAELALELLVQTRTPRLAEAINRSANTAKGPDVMAALDTDHIRVSQELALEQRFALAAADANPDKAIKLIKDSLSRGISGNVLSLLQKLNKSDSKKASELAADVVKKVVDSDLSKSTEDLTAAFTLLQYAYKPPPANQKDKPFAFTDQQVKDLATKIANTLLQPSSSMTTSMLLMQAMPMLEKFAPEKSAQLRQRKAENDNTMPAELKGIQQLQTVLDPNASAEDILAQLPKLSSDFEKSAAYSALARKVGDIEDEARAKKIIDQIPDEKTRNAAMDQFETARITRTAAAGKLDDARKQIGNITKKSMQVQRLVALAIDQAKKGGDKDVETAKALMKDARALITEPAETSEQMADLMEVVRGYTKVDPETAFKLYEPTVPQFSDLLDASAVLARFDQQEQTFRKGELSLRMSGGGGFAMPFGNESASSAVFRYVGQLQGLAKVDLDRAVAAADRFTRGDARTIFRLYALQGFLRDDKDGEPAAPAQMGVIF